VRAVGKGSRRLIADDVLERFDRDLRRASMRLEDASEAAPDDQRIGLALSLVGKMIEIIAFIRGLA
jgi:hypothetical protein